MDGNYQETSDFEQPWTTRVERQKLQVPTQLAKRCRESVKEDLKERRERDLVQASQPVLSIRNNCQSYANLKIEVTSLRGLDEKFR